MYRMWLALAPSKIRITRAQRMFCNVPATHPPPKTTKLRLTWSTYVKNPITWSTFCMQMNELTKETGARNMLEGNSLRSGKWKMNGKIIIWYYLILASTRFVYLIQTGIRKVNGTSRHGMFESTKETLDMYKYNIFQQQHKEKLQRYLFIYFSFLVDLQSFSPASTRPCSHILFLPQQGKRCPLHVRQYACCGQSPWSLVICNGCIYWSTFSYYIFFCSRQPPDFLPFSSVGSTRWFWGWGWLMDYCI